MGRDNLIWPEQVERRIRAEARNLDEQKTPTEVRFCKRCVVSNQRPRIVFDDEGVCSACRYAERKKNEINWDARETELRNLCEKFRRPGHYDCIVPCSGGKDSAFVAWTLRNVFAMHPLCVTWEPFLFTDIGRRNLESFKAHFDVISAAPNRLHHRRLARLGLEFYGDNFLPFIYGQLTFPMRVACAMGIPLVFFGENQEAEYGGDPAANDKRCWDYVDWQRIYMKGGGVGELADCGRNVGAHIEVSDLYRLPDLRRMVEASVQFHWLSYYLPWHPQGNYYLANQELGFEANDGRSEGTYSKYASLDDKLDGLHYYFAYLKFGIGRCTSDAAHEVRDGEIERNEAAALVRRYDGEFPTRHLEESLAYLGMDEEHLGRVCERFKAPHLWSGDTLSYRVWDDEKIAV